MQIGGSWPISSSSSFSSSSSSSSCSSSSFFFFFFFFLLLLLLLPQGMQPMICSIFPTCAPFFSWRFPKMVLPNHPSIELYRWIFLQINHLASGFCKPIYIYIYTYTCSPPQFTDLTPAQMIWFDHFARHGRPNSSAVAVACGAGARLRRCTQQSWQIHPIVSPLSSRFTIGIKIWYVYVMYM